ncbi:MAG: SigE family RNA polymerase sigma factor [Marmoricola sp.]
MGLRSITLADTATPAYEDFVAARWSTLYRTAYLLTGAHADAEDLAQTTLVKAFQSWSKVAAAASPDAYVRRIMTNAFISSRRPLRASRERLVDAVPERQSPQGTDDERLLLWPHIAALPPKQRAVIVLRYYEDLSEQQIADALGCSPGTVKSNASLALQSLRNRMGHDEGATS